MDVRHVIDARSPLANWLEPGGVDSDLGSEIVVIVRERGEGHSLGWVGEVSEGPAPTAWGGLPRLLLGCPGDGARGERP